jgi:hypothetical protein
MWVARVIELLVEEQMKTMIEFGGRYMGSWGWCGGGQGSGRVSSKAYHLKRGGESGPWRLFLASAIEVAIALGHPLHILRPVGALHESTEVANFHRPPLHSLYACFLGCKAGSEL